MSHHSLPANEIPRHLGYILGLVTATDFIASSSVLVTSEHIRGGIAASPEEFLNILTAYAVVAMIEIPFIEKLSRRWHYRNLMQGALGLFIVGSVSAVFCEHATTLVLARIVQGVGGGGLFTMSRVYLQLSVPGPERPRQLKGYILGLLGSVAPASWLATRLVQDHGWQAVFIMQAAVASLALVLTSTLLKSERHTPRSLGKLDWAMVLGFALGSVLLLHTLEDLEIELLGIRQILTLGASLVALGFSIYRLNTHQDPVLNPKIIQGRRFLYGLGFYCAYYLINGATTFVLPKLFEAGLGFGTDTTGVLLSYSGAVTVLLLPLYFLCAPKMGDRRYVIAAGFGVATIAMLWLSFISTSSTPETALLGALSLRGLFPILGVVQIAGLAYKEVAHEDFAHAYALKNIGRQLATLASASLASQLWQQDIAQFRTDMIGALPSLAPSHPLPPEALSRLLDQQASILAGGHVLQLLALLCAIAAALMLCQKNLH